MRKSFIATLALGALVIASCQKENDYAPKAESPVFTASFDTEAPADPDTKTQLVDDKGVKKSLWDSGDVIRLFNGTNTTGCTADYTTEYGGATVSFKTNVKGYTGTQFIATYPASEADYAWWNSTKDNIFNKLWLTDTQTAVEGGYDPKAHIAVAYTNTKELAFKNVVALLKISVSGTGVENISVSADKIVGNFSYNTEKGEVSKTRDDYSNPSKVTLSGTFTDGKDYYIAVLPGTYSTLTLKVNDKVFKTKATESEFKANSIYNMGTVNGSKTLYLKPNDNWKSAQAWFAVYLFDNDTKEKEWVKMEKVDDTVYKAEVPSKYPNVIFCRMNSANSESLSWDNTWNQTNDLNFDATNNCYTVTEGAWSKGDGTWSVYK